MISWFGLALLASMLWGLTYVIGQYLLRYLDPIAIIFLNNIFICIVFGIYFGLTHQWHTVFAKFSGNYKVVTALFAYITIYLIASILILKSIHSGNASLAAIIESSYPIFTMLFAYLLLQQKQFNWGTLAGTGLIIAGLIVIQLTASS